MRSFIILGLLAGLGFVLLGYAARTPGQAAISNTVILIGILILVVSGAGLVLSLVRGYSKDDLER